MKVAQGRDRDGVLMEAAAADRLSMQDPHAQYPRPPFPEQPQQAPGLAGRMDPRPDHGETSYKGSGKLIGRKARITGGDSGIGRAAAIAFAREDAAVATSHLSDEETDAREVVELIGKDGRKALSLLGDIMDEAWCRRLVEEAVAGLEGLDKAEGPPRRGRLEQPQSRPGGACQFP
jgi:hypothetical protein